MQCRDCDGNGYVLTCSLCHRDMPVYCYLGGCEYVEICDRCDGTGEDPDAEDETMEEVTL